jgi:hypothetical protein
VSASRSTTERPYAQEGGGAFEAIRVRYLAVCCVVADGGKGDIDDGGGEEATLECLIRVDAFGGGERAEEVGEHGVAREAEDHCVGAAAESQIAATGAGRSVLVSGVNVTTRWR